MYTQGVENTMYVKSARVVDVCPFLAEVFSILDMNERMNEGMNERTKRKEREERLLVRVLISLVPVLRSA